eukprot:SAG11_NODE_17380_length_520_cov_1.090261_1_plen_32_part_10
MPREWEEGGAEGVGGGWGRGSERRAGPTEVGG